MNPVTTEFKLKVKHKKSGKMYLCDHTKKQLKRRQENNYWVMVQEDPKSMMLSFKATILEPVERD